MNFRSYFITPILSLFLLGSVLSAKVLPDDQLSKIISEFRARYGNTKGWSAEYTREAISKTMALLKTAERHDVAKGSLFFKPPHFLRLDQVSPQEELLLTDGKTLWWYLPSKKQAYKYPSQSFGKELRLLSDVLKGLKDMEESFLITLNANPEGNTYHLILTPDPPWQDIDHLELFIIKGIFDINQMDIFNSIGGITRFLFSNWEEKDLFKKDFFSFSPPLNVKVIEK